MAMLSVGKVPVKLWLIKVILNHTYPMILNIHTIFKQTLVIFTGKMKGSRDEMKKHAKSIGIQVASSVSAKKQIT